jgi:hypothetical protein
LFGFLVHLAPAGVILELIDATGMEKFSVRRVSDFNNNEWAVFDDTGIDTNIPYSDTSDGSSCSFTLTGPDPGTLVFDGKSFPINPKLATPIAGLRITLFGFRSGSGSTELFFDDLMIVPEPASASVLLVAGALVIFRRR